jgi:hypothetical protein
VCLQIQKVEVIDKQAVQIQKLKDINKQAVKRSSGLYLIP